ncbi:sterol desaturase family protein [Andreprevotia chitinilytica]|uniref:sterol desaturase family protein n=1 Tax=Andreprevotia chitinilytica TaxID=396808 RepID=UPI00068FC875|nr:sterol desaturase family protein [Andreprevotia chitinilytica]
MHLNFLTLEHSKAAYHADFVMYASAVVGLSAFLIMAGPHELRPEMLLLVLVGVGSWSPIEYALHRFVLHGMQPFRRWHAEHHRRPAALIGAPTLLSAALIGTLVFLPALLLGNLWQACALTLGVLTGYLAYTITHHAIHHWHSDNAWLIQRKRWHAQHHQRLAPNDRPGCYGVTTAFWDHVLGSSAGTSSRP